MTAAKKDLADLAADAEPVTDDDVPAEKGRLVLATGSVVAAPVEGLQVATLHYDEKYGATVPVVSTFVLD